MGDMSPRTKRYVATTAGGAIGGASMGGILYASGAAKKMGPALGWGAMIGAVTGLATAGVTHLVETTL